MKKWSRFSAWFSDGVLVYTLGVILWGAFVRATGSGAGCGRHWPLCNGEVFPRAKQVETWIEFSHRFTSGLNLVLILLLAASVFRLYPKGSLVRKAASFSVLFILGEALIGAGLVLFGLVTHDQSAARAISLGLHLGNTFLLTGSLVLICRWSRVKSPRFSLPRLGSGGWAAWMALVSTFLVGVSGAVTALGDTLWPAASGGLAEGLKADFSPLAPLLLKLRVIHPVAAILTGVGLVFWASPQVFTPPTASSLSAKRSQRLGMLLLFFVLFQQALGFLNLVLLVPIWTQLTHLGVANLLWLVLVLFFESRFSKDESDFGLEDQSLNRDFGFFSQFKRASRGEVH
ncbi:MAG: COX15/CtaA family protein [Bdellovibrionia bacterium]